MCGAGSVGSRVTGPCQLAVTELGLGCGLSDGRPDFIFCFVVSTLPFTVKAVYKDAIAERKYTITRSAIWVHKLAHNSISR